MLLHHAMGRYSSVKVGQQQQRVGHCTSYNGQQYTVTTIGFCLQRVSHARRHVIIINVINQ